VFVFGIPWQYIAIRIVICLSCIAIYQIHICCIVTPLFSSTKVPIICILIILGSQIIIIRHALVYMISHNESKVSMSRKQVDMGYPDYHSLNIIIQNCLQILHRVKLTEEMYQLMYVLCTIY
jgi:hypothetical protein